MTDKKKNLLFTFFNNPPSWKELVVDLLAFALTVSIAFLQDWRAADIVWAAWFSSLLMGLSFFLLVIFKLMWDKSKGIHLKEEEGSGPGCLGSATMFFLGLLAWLVGSGPLRIVLIILIILDLVGIILNIITSNQKLRPNLDSPAIRVLLFFPSALFIFFFFVGHFGGFHAGHAAFLGFLVPLEFEMKGTIDSFSNARAMFFSFFKILLLAYWPYLLSVGIMNFSSYRKALMNSKNSNYMFLPYKNVIRIHLLIFVLAPIAMARIGKVVLIVVLFFFYFPVERMIAWFRKR